MSLPGPPASGGASCLGLPLSVWGWVWVWGGSWADVDGTAKSEVSETAITSLAGARRREIRRFVVKTWANIATPKRGKYTIGAKTPCASIDAGIRDWDVL